MSIAAPGGATPPDAAGPASKPPAPRGSFGLAAFVEALLRAVFAYFEYGGNVVQHAAAPHVRVALLLTHLHAATQRLAEESKEEPRFMGRSVEGWPDEDDDGLAGCEFAQRRRHKLVRRAAQLLEPEWLVDAPAPGPESGRGARRPASPERGGGDAAAAPAIEAGVCAACGRHLRGRGQWGNPNCFRCSLVDPRPDCTEELGEGPLGWARPFLFAQLIEAGEPLGVGGDPDAAARSWPPPALTQDEEASVRGGGALFPSPVQTLREWPQLADPFAGGCAA